MLEFIFTAKQTFIIDYMKSALVKTGGVQWPLALHEKSYWSGKQK